MNFQDMLSRKRVLVSDGALGTELAKKGLRPGECPELLNAETPDWIVEIARSYVEAGSDIILTNTFGGSPVKLARYGIGDRTEELNERGVRLAVEAAGGRAAVYASVGPTGEFLEPLGAMTEAEMTAAFGRQVRALASGGAQGVVLETMTDLGEIVCALRAVREHTNLPAVCSMTFDRGARGFATMMGVTPERAARELDAAGADAVGANCGTGIADIIEITRLMRPHTRLPLWMKPNAGMPELVEGNTVYRESPEDFAARIPDLLIAGAAVVGGCCGTTPEHIRRVREAVDTFRG
jgi:5-methyltetrahydrofolate--homocysteine methyltransferase